VNKEEQKKLLIETMEADEKDGLYKTNNVAQQTAVEWLFDQIPLEWTIKGSAKKIFEQAKQMEKEQMVKFAEFVSSHPDKNKNYEGEMLHAKSKYDGAERTVDLLEQYYNETYNK
jgi:hypothetical protein